MDKITHQVRAEHWTKIMNECMDSGMSKAAWCRANGVSEKQFFYWQRILRREAFENSRNSSLPATVRPNQELVPATPTEHMRINCIRKVRMFVSDGIGIFLTIRSTIRSDIRFLCPCCTV